MGSPLENTNSSSGSSPCPPNTPCPPPSNVTVVNSTVLETAPQVELPSVFNSPFRIPCFKSSLLAGTAAGGIMTASLLILKSKQLSYLWGSDLFVCGISPFLCFVYTQTEPFFFSSNMGMVTFVGVSIGKWFVVSVLVTHLYQYQHHTVATSGFIVDLNSRRSETW